MCGQETVPVAPEDRARAAFAKLAAESYAAFTRVGTRTRDLAGAVSVFDTERDRVIGECPSFPSAVEALGSLPLIRERYGPDNLPRITTQFGYTAVAEMASATDGATLDRVWASFSQQLAEAEWTYCKVANVTYLEADPSGPFLFDDGLEIRPRASSFLIPLIGEAGWQALAEDWSGFGASKFVLVGTNRIAKTPENATLMGTGTIFPRLRRLLLAMRLHKEGDAGVGRIFHGRPGRVLSYGGVGSSIIESGQRHGKNYMLRHEDVAPITELYRSLAPFAPPYDGRWKTVERALRSYEAIFARTLGQDDDRVLDAVTALEALVGSDTETTFKVSFRVASILADSDEERATLFGEVKTYYDTRSKIVHGAQLKEKHLALIRDDSPLRTLTRRLLVAFLRYSSTREGQAVPSGEKFLEQIDALLLQSGRRQALRAGMGLTVTA